MNLQEQKAAAMRYFDAAAVLGMTALTPNTIPAFLRYIGIECEDKPQETERPELELLTESAEPEKANGMFIFYAHYDSKRGLDGIIDDLEGFCAENTIEKCEVIYQRVGFEPLESSIQKRCSARGHGYKMGGGTSIFSLKPFFKRNESK
jgi:hypothetical protein